jgi:hypothetical protein
MEQDQVTEERGNNVEGGQNGKREMMRREERVKEKT